MLLLLLLGRRREGREGGSLEEGRGKGELGLREKENSFASAEPPELPGTKSRNSHW